MFCIFACAVFLILLPLFTLSGVLAWMLVREMDKEKKKAQKKGSDINYVTVLKLHAVMNEEMVVINVLDLSILRDLWMVSFVFAEKIVKRAQKAQKKDSKKDQ